MFKKADFDVALKFPWCDSLLRVTVSGWEVNLAGHDFGLRKQDGKWIVTDIDTGYAVGAKGVTRGEAVAVLKERFLPAYLRTVEYDYYRDYVRAFEEMPRLGREAAARLCVG